MKKVTKAIIPAAGFGTRFLPQTKAMPKEMLPIIDKPIIQYVVEEAVAAGITDIIIVTGFYKRSIEDHFDHNAELEQRLRDGGKDELAKQIHQIGDLANFIYVRQKGVYGTGTPVLNSAHLIGNEPFLVLYPDDFFLSEVPRAVQLMEQYEKYGKSVIALTEVPKSAISSYGVADIDQEAGENTYKLKNVVEKPSAEDAPSNFASVGGYILTPDIIPILQQQKPANSGELYLSEAIGKLISQDDVYGKVIAGTWHDTGNKQKYLEAVVDFALRDPELNGSFKNYLESKLKEKA
jgi:UTP--glucose-1-phosphate uridylyltransferase